MITGNWITRHVYVDGERLPEEPSQKLWNHSPDGFNWGYGGSGPAQLALALLMHYLADNQLAVKHHQAFKFDVIAGLPQDDFSMDPDVVRGWIDDNVKKGETER
jgi:hypothetical protein